MIAGLVAWYLLVFQILLGVVYAAGLGRLLIAPRWKLRLHRWAALGLLTAVGVHVSTIVLTHYRGWGLAEVLEIGPGSIARNCGVATFWLLLVIAIARWNPVFGALGPRLGRQVHRLAYPMLVLGTVHGVLAGSNAESLAISGPGIAGLSALAAAFLGRYHKTLSRRRARRRPKHVLAASA
jgi:DMSO/TMAO reductase YedYZ heme-binding membrane subunit